jgi:hypothetical protein
VAQGMVTRGLNGIKEVNLWDNDACILPFATGQTLVPLS